MHRRALLIGMAALLAGAPVALAEEPAAEVVELRFGWPVGLESQVESRSRRLRDGQPRLPFEPVIHFTTRVGEHEKGVVVAHADARVDGIPEELADPQQQMFAALLRAAAGAPPDLVIGADGALLELANLEEVAAAVKGVLEPIMTDPEAPPGVRMTLGSMIGQLTSEEVLRASASQTWDPLVAFWSGGDLELGAAYELQSEEAIPVLGNASVPMTVRFGAVERVPCFEGSQDAARCVRLEAVSTPDPEALLAAMEGYLAQLAALAAEGKPVPPIAFDSLDMRSAFTVVTEPDGLIPHSLRLSREVTIGAKDEAGESARVTDSEVTTYRFTHGGR